MLPAVADGLPTGLHHAPRRRGRDSNPDFPRLRRACYQHLPAHFSRENVRPLRKAAPKKTSGKPAPNTKAPAGSYALPGGGPGGADAYPINTKGRGANALARVEQNGTPAEKAKVPRAVEANYPGLPSNKGHSDAAAAQTA